MIIGIDSAGTRFGGSFVYLKSLLEDYEPDRFKEIKKIIVWGAASALDKIEADGMIEKVNVKMLESRNIIALFIWKFYLTYFLAPRKCDVLYVPGGIILPSAQKKIIMLHNLLPFDNEIRKLYRGRLIYFKFALLKILYKFSNKIADAVIFPSKLAKEVIEDKLWNKNANSAVIYHCAGKIFRNFKPHLKEEKKDGEVIRLLCVSAITEYKGQFELLDEFEELIGKNRNCSLTFVGGISERLKAKFYERVDKINKTQEFINYLGIIDYDKMPEIYLNCDVLAFPSKIESFGYPLIEAAVFNKTIYIKNNSYQDILNFFDIHDYFSGGLFNQFTGHDSSCDQNIIRSYTNSEVTFKFITQN